MYRRAKAGEITSPAPGSGGGKATAAAAASGGVRPAPTGVSSSGRRHDHHNKMSPAALLTITCIVIFGSFLLLSIISPASMQEAEKKMLEAEQLMENEMAGLFGGGLHEKVVPPIPHEPQRRDRSVDATDAMLQQDSSWVDGEKKLKQKLKVLAERQAQGKDLGVPVLTRYLGEDIPAWAGEGVDVEEWKKKIEQRYAEMREEENKWREKVAQYFETGTTK